MIELRGLTKRYGPTLAVHDLSFQVQPGKVTGFLGPNGARKSTSMRMALASTGPPPGRRWSIAAPTRSSVRPFGSSGRCWTPIGQVIAGSSHTVVRVRTPAAAELGRLLARVAESVRHESDSLLTVAGLTTDDVGELAYASGIRLHELALQSASLEEAYMELSQHHLDHGTSQLTPRGA